MVTDPVPDPEEKIETDEIIILHELPEEVLDSTGRQTNMMLPGDSKCIPADRSKRPPPSPPPDPDPRP
jgi:hypothetical protein